MRAFLFWGVAGLLLIGCGGSTSNVPDGGGGDAGSPIDSGTMDATVSDSGADSGGDAGKFHCSADLRSVLDENDMVVKTCPPDQGCAGGQCIAACAAAAAGRGSIGCDYLVPTPSFYPTIKPPCFAVFVANNWPSDVKLAVSLDGKNYDVTQFGRIAMSGVPEAQWSPIPSSGIPAGKAAVLFMSHDPASMNATPLTCPVPPAVSQTGGTALPGSGQMASITARGKAWHITSTVPITAYDILPYGGAKSYLPSAEVLFPTSSFGTTYLGVVPIRGPAVQPQWAQLVAVNDNTKVTIVPTVNLPSGTNVMAAPMGQMTTFTLAAGEFIQWQDSLEMSGTTIQATDLVSFTGGHTYDCYKSATSNGGGCDSAHQQIPPLAAFGSEYVGAAYATRLASMAEESISYRIVGAADGTTLTYDPAVPNAPATIAAGKVVDFEAVGSFVVKSQDAQHPFYLGQTMSGCLLTSMSRPGCSTMGSCCLGDEEFVNLLPPAQYLAKYVFFTDPTYPTSNLVFVRKKTVKGFEDVKLDCLGNVTGWKAIGAGGTYEIANVDLIRANTKNGTCDNGPHSAESTAPFGLMVWGLDQYSSYAYPAGGNVATINGL